MRSLSENCSCWSRPYDEWTPQQRCYAIKIVINLTWSEALDCDGCLEILLAVSSAPLDYMRVDALPTCQGRLIIATTLDTATVLHSTHWHQYLWACAFFVFQLYQLEAPNITYYILWQLNSSREQPWTEYRHSVWRYSIPTVENSSSREQSPTKRVQHPHIF